jgi:hypothetical protein
MWVNAASMASDAMQGLDHENEAIVQVWAKSVPEGWINQP